MAVVLLTGADRLSLDSVAFSLADSYAVSYTHLRAHET